MNVMLTYNGKDVFIIPLRLAETVVYQVQERVDQQAREQGKDYGELVSTRRL